MKSPFQRIAALALCFSLTLGAFAYRPSEAKAIAGVDDAVVIGALLSAFAGGCGLIFSNNGMTSGELAQGLTDKWNEFNEAAESGASSFAAWLGFEDTSALLGALSFSGGKLAIPRAIAQKFAEFTTWLTENLGVTAGGEEKSVASIAGGYKLLLADGSSVSLGTADPETWTAVPGDILFTFDYDTAADFSYSLTLNNGKELAFSFVRNDGKYILSGVYDGRLSYKHGNSVYNSYFYNISKGLVLRGPVSLCVFNGYIVPVARYIDDTNSVGKYGTWGPTASNTREYYFIEKLSVSELGLSQSLSSRLSVFAPSYYQNPTIDLPAEGEEAVNPTLSGVGDGSATSIEELLQKILEQLQANTLAPTLDLAGTESGGNTDTDEDAKPYLPYIPQIFEKIKELPGTLANIWESIKGIPAAIAEKIGAFFTTLWGWLQSIIDAITALPAAIAEKVGALFKPDEALLSEITDTFKGKFGFFSTLKQFGNDLFGMTPETEPPVIWVHLENAESKFGYNYGDKQKIFDMTWYQKYKASVDGLLSGFLWLGYLWLLFKRAPAILGGMQLSADDAPRSADMPDVLSSSRLGAGDGSTMFRGDGFTMRDKGGRSK